MPDFVLNIGMDCFRGSKKETKDELLQKLYENKNNLSSFFDKIELRAMGCLFQLINWVKSNKMQRVKLQKQCQQILKNGQQAFSIKQNEESLQTSMGLSVLFLIYAYNNPRYFNDALLYLSESKQLIDQQRVVIDLGMQVVRSLMMREDEKWQDVIIDKVKSFKKQLKSVKSTKQHLQDYIYFKYSKKKIQDTKQNSFLLTPIANNLSNQSKNYTGKSRFSHADLLGRLIHASIHGPHPEDITKLYQNNQGHQLLKLGYKLLKEQQVKKAEQLQIKVVSRALSSTLISQKIDSSSLKKCQNYLKLFDIDEPPQLFSFQNLKSRARICLSSKSLSKEERVKLNVAYYFIYTTRFGIQFNQLVNSLNQHNLSALRKITPSQKYRLIEENSLLYFAVRAGFLQGVKQMLKQLKFNDCPYESNNPVNCAAYYGFEQMLVLLRQHRFDFKKKSKSGLLAKEQALNKNARKLVEQGQKDQQCWFEYRQVKMCIDEMRLFGWRLKKKDIQSNSACFQSGKISQSYFHSSSFSKQFKSSSLINLKKNNYLKTMYYKFMQFKTLARFFNKQNIKLRIFKNYDLAFHDLFSLYLQFQENNNFISLVLLTMDQEHQRGDMSLIDSICLEAIRVFVVRHTEVVHSKDTVLKFIQANK